MRCDCCDHQADRPSRLLDHVELESGWYLPKSPDKFEMTTQYSASLVNVVSGTLGSRDPDTPVVEPLDLESSLSHGESEEAIVVDHIGELMDQVSPYSQQVSGVA